MIGLDEVGRGCIAGPVVVGAVALRGKDLLKYFNKQGEWLSKDVDIFWRKIKDSKLIKEPLREMLAPQIKRDALAWAIAESSVQEIDEINILKAVHLAMFRAVQEIETKLGRIADYILVDGNQAPKALLTRNLKTIVKGDQKSLTIASASVIAKVYRDQLMGKLDLEFQGYNLKQHKGYTTPAHKVLIRKLGYSEIHRKSFKI